MRVLVTGARGFLGWHLCARLHARTAHEVIPVPSDAWSRLPELASSADAVLHIAGINRGSEEEVEHGNVRLARELGDALVTAGRPLLVVFANSIQAGNGTPYGNGKETSAALLKEVAETTGGSFVDVVFPNLFGEHGRPAYNSFVATFAHRVVAGETPAVQDREVELLHAQAAAQVLIDALKGEGTTQVRPTGVTTSVGEVLRILTEQFADYQRGDIPALPSRLHVDLFNTLRAAMFPRSYPMPLMRHEDPRGSLVETVRAHGSEGQTFVSTTVPGITRGQHFHLRKVERFVVVAGRARISLRKVLSDEVIHFDVDGSTPAIVDMPTLWAHNITNTGDGELTTMFWTNELFNPEDADTYPEAV